MVHLARGLEVPRLATTPSFSSREGPGRARDEPGGERGREGRACKGAGGPASVEREACPAGGAFGEPGPSRRSPGSSGEGARRSLAFPMSGALHVARRQRDGHPFGSYTAGGDRRSYARSTRISVETFVSSTMASPRTSSRYSCLRRIQWHRRSMDFEIGKTLLPPLARFVCPRHQAGSIQTRSWTRFPGCFRGVDFNGSAGEALRRNLAMRSRCR